jgi:hypothetical protein
MNEIYKTKPEQLPAIWQDWGFTPNRFLKPVRCHFSYSRITASRNNQINFFATDLNGLNGLSQIFSKTIIRYYIPVQSPLLLEGAGGRIKLLL